MSLEQIKAFRERILAILAMEGPLGLEQINYHVKSLDPDLCDDDIECTCKTLFQEGAEWKHQVKQAVWDLKRLDKIKLENKKWSLTR